MEPTHDLYREELIISNLVSEIYNSCLNPLIEVDCFSGCLGLIGISFESIAVKRNLKRINDQELAATRVLESDWFVLDEEGPQNFKDMASSQNCTRNKLIEDMDVVLRIELRNILIKLSRDQQSPSLFKKNFVVHSIRIIDGLTYENYRQNKDYNDVELFNICSLDYDRNPSFKIKVSGSIVVQESLKTFN